MQICQNNLYKTTTVLSLSYGVEQNDVKYRTCSAN